MPPTPPVDIVALGKAIEESLLQPLTAEQARAAASATISLIHVLFYEHNHEERKSIEAQIAKLGFPMQQPANRAGLAYIAMLFPNLPLEMKIRLMRLKPTDL